jgi:hypothetical protein
MSNPKSWHASLCFEKTITVRRLRVKATMRNGDGWMGRMGGGWVWKFGILAGRTEWVLELFVMSVRVTILPKEKA